MKMAVVGCEASGKTVFMCALADYFGRDAANNPLRLKLTPENAAANRFERFQFRQMRCQRQWPPATAPDRTVEIKWSLRHNGASLASIELLEFGGETFRAAFRDGEAAQRDGSVGELLKYLGDADFFVVLVSLKALLTLPDTLSDEDFDRETEALWVTRGILKFILEKRPNAGVVIGLTQADKYRNELGEAGGPKAFFASHWPTVAAAIGDIPVVDVASVSKTDEAGNPAEGYHTHGILPVMRIFAKHCFGSEDALENGAAGIRPGAGIPVQKVGAPDAKVAALTGDMPPIKTSLSSAISTVRSGSAAEAPVAARKVSPVPVALAVTLLVLAGGIIWGLSNRAPDPNAAKAAAPQAIPVVVMVTNTVEKLVEVEKVVKTEIPVTNTVEKLVRVAVTNTVERRIEVPVTNTVEKIVKVKEVVTNVVEKPMSVGLALTNLPSATTVSAPTNMTLLSEAELQKQVPPGYRIWTDYNGRRIIARWTGVAVDESGITIVTRYNRRIDAVLWKFSPEDQKYIKDEIKLHAERGELMSDGKWIRNPLFKAN